MGFIIISRLALSSSKSIFFFAIKEVMKEKGGIKVHQIYTLEALIADIYFHRDISVW